MRLPDSRNPSLAIQFLVLFFSSVFLIQVQAQDPEDGEEETVTLFYPPLPDAPYIQYLTNFSNAGDVREKKKKRGGWLAKFVLGEENPEDKEGPVKPYGVAIKNGKIHVVDTRGGGYAIFDVPNKDYSFTLGSGSAAMSKPVNITIDKEGTKYITDTGRNQILAFDSNDKFLKAYGKLGQFRPSDVLVVKDRLYVVDIQGHQVIVLDKESGRQLNAFGGPGGEEDNFFQPTNIALGPDNHLYISDTGNFRVQKFTLEGKFVQTFGAGVGNAPGSFARPKGVAVDHMGRLYVVDAAFQNVQIFNSTGELLLFFGEPAGTHSGGLDLPADVYIDYESVPYFEKYADPAFKLEYIILVANQFGQSKVSVFGFGSYEGISYTEDE